MFHAVLLTIFRKLRSYLSILTERKWLHTSGYVYAKV